MALSLKCQRSSPRGHDGRLTWEPDLGNQRLLVPSPAYLECKFCSLFPQLGSFSRIHPWENNVLLKPYELNTWLNPVKTSTETFTILSGGVGINLSCGHLRQPSYVSSLVYLICHLPFWSGLSLFFGFSLHSISWVQFQISPGKVPKFQINNWQASQETEKWTWIKGILRGNSELTINLYVGRIGPSVRCLWATTTWVREAPKCQLV